VAADTQPAVEQAAVERERAAVERVVRDAMQPRWFGRGVDVEALAAAISSARAKRFAPNAALLSEAEALCNQLVAAHFAQRVMVAAVRQAAL